MTLTHGHSVDVGAVRRRHPIEEVVAEAGIELRRTGRGYLGCCPFHEDHTPSMSVAGVPDRFHCFGCGASGDAIDFIGRLHGLGFREAVAFLEDPSRMPLTPLPHAQRVPAPARLPAAPELASERAHAINGLAWQWYSRPVPHAYALAYLRHHRGIDLDTAERELGQPLVGHSGNGWTGLTDHLREHGVTDDELLALDLAQHTRHGRLIDTLRDRLVVPIRSTEGRVAGFVGRDTGGHPAAPKYRNPTRTAVYDKATSVYRPVHGSRPDATVVVVEGALDALAVTGAAARAGRLHEIIACSTLGTAVPPLQARHVLALTTGPVVIALDGDAAGHEGTLRWVNATCLDAGRLVYVTNLPDGADPADWLSQHGTEGLSGLDPAQRHTDSLVDEVTPRLPGRELAQLACRDKEPVRTALAHLASLLPGIPSGEARELIDGVTAEMTRQGWNPNGIFTSALDVAASRTHRPLPPPPDAYGRELL